MTGSTPSHDTHGDSHEATLFRGEYEREMESWFRRRFLVLCAVFAGWETLSLSALALAWTITRRNAVTGSQNITIDEEAVRLSEVLGGSALPGLVLTSIATYGLLAFFAFVRAQRVESRQGLVHQASWMIVLLGAVHLALESLTTVFGGTDLLNPAWAIFFWHFLASLVLPWTPRESVRPMVPLIGAYLVADFMLSPSGISAIRADGTAVERFSWLAFLIRSAMLPLVLAPGLVACWWRLRRHRRRFGRRMASQGFMELRRELSQARKIHESLFPRPVKHEDVEFDLFYRPMRELGGDFVQAWTDPLDRFHVVVIDVTGHGLAAAMTVNRIAGELDRVRAENPLLSPGAVLAGLNRYVHLTLTRHVIFGTAVAAQLDPHTGRLTVANAGHPAAILRRAAGSVEAHESSAYLLGAVAHTDFEVAEEVTYLHPGDVLMLVTDGVLDARDRRGRVFGEARLREACSRNPAPPRWSEFLAGQVEQWSGSVLHDDLLIATLALAPNARVVPQTTSRASTLREIRSDAVGEAPMASSGSR
ncbi:MAG: serine/threonine-protein phosphatase [Phycisphaerae bacterium]|nr:serine/threonine-protein phosphatase [Phycisphaerae bacterium]